MATGPWPAIGDGDASGGGLWAPSPAQLDALFSDDQQQGFFGGSLARLPSPPPLSAAAHLLGYPPQDNFDVFHEQDLARLAAQVAQKAELQQQLSKRGMLGRADDSSFPLAAPKLASQHASSSVIVPTLPSHADSINTGSAGVLQALQGSSITLDRPADDGYNWRKYGQKAVKGGKYPRSYYKCTLNCPVRKNVEHSLDGRIIKIVYRGQHCHERPSKRFKVCGGLLNELDCFNDTEDASSRSQFDCQGYYGKPITSIGTMGDPSLPTKEEGDEQFSGSGDNREEGDDEIGAVDGIVGDANANERNAPGQKIIVSTTSDVDLLDDGYRWRKYGQKVVRGNPHPRSYYKCTFQGCDVKKHIERSSQEPHAVITTYEGKHIHDVPASRNRVQAAGQPYCTEETYTDQTPANFCSSSEKRNYGTITLNHLAF
ncbi:hypothetical protein QYE76_039945 [Lolium multiflorum]|uniref:WRKY domain-containing protein n=1 Tax=Lolium multiflorum TaxID=4521 RepID=A0AAD8WS97_LOLMU|nr:hypothetical protein QYE76_039945 [Lolium multiflorum]